MDDLFIHVDVYGNRESLPVDTSIVDVNRCKYITVVFCYVLLLGYLTAQSRIQG
jgi:hypothetical protein